MNTPTLGQKTAVRFMLVSLLFLLLGCLEGLMHPTKWMLKDFYLFLLGLEPQHLKPFFGYFVGKIHTHVSLLGWVTSALMGLFYFTAEQIKGTNHYRSFLCTANFWLHVAGVLILVFGFHLVGLVALPTGHAIGSPEFRAAASQVKLLVVIGGLCVFFSAVIFTFNLSATLLKKNDLKKVREN